MKQLQKDPEDIRCTSINQQVAEQVIEAVRSHDHRAPCNSCVIVLTPKKCFNELKCHNYSAYTPISTKESHV